MFARIYPRIDNLLPCLSVDAAHELLDLGQPSLVYKIAIWGFPFGDVFIDRRFHDFSDFAKILEFDIADEAWAAEAKTPEVRQQISAGADYAKVMKDLAKVDKRFKDDQAKNKKITGRNKREKAEKKAKANYQKGLKSIASKLEKIHKKHGDSYYGHAAFRTRESWVNSYGREMIDELGKKK